MRKFNCKLASFFFFFLIKYFKWEFQGAITHQDFAGHKGTIRTGDVQVNSELHYLFFSG